MAPTHELLHGLTEVTKYLRDDPRRLALAERAGTSEVSHKLFMRLYCARHPSRMAHYSTEMQDSCPLSGRNLAFMRLVRHVTGRGGRRSRQPWSHRSTKPAAASPPRQRMTVSKSTPAAIAILAGPRPARAGTASSTRVSSGPSRSRASTGPRCCLAGSSTLNSSNSITSCALVTHTAPHSLIASWQPADWAEVTGPGTAISGRPWSYAWRAVFSAPLRSAASTTTVPRLRAAITRLRTRNPGLVGIRPGGHSLTSAPISVILRKSPS